jgi:uncharacterized membrane protein YdfJ with MMPL/SSD domain
MEIIRHLSNEELMDLAIESDELSLRPTLTSLPGWARASTDRPEEYWQRQRSNVWSRLSSSESAPASKLVRRSPVLAWSTVAALALLAGLMLDQASFVPPPHKAQADPDHELLVAVERALQKDGPAALEPAALLADEMVQEIPVARSPIRKKEPTHEN